MPSESECECAYVHKCMCVRECMCVRDSSWGPMWRCERFSPHRKKGKRVHVCEVSRQKMCLFALEVAVVYVSVCDSVCECMWVCSGVCKCMWVYVSECMWVRVLIAHICVSTWSSRVWVYVSVCQSVRGCVHHAFTYTTPASMFVHLRSYLCNHSLLHLECHPISISTASVFFQFKKTGKRLQHTAASCNRWQHTTPHCNTLQTSANET